MSQNQTSNELVKYLDKSELDKNKQENLLVAFNDLFKQATDLIVQADQIEVTNESQLEEMKKAREIRLALVKVRTTIDKKHEIFTHDNVLYKRALDGLRALGRALTQPKEKELEAKEKFIENKERERKEQLRRERLDELKLFYANLDFEQAEKELSYYKFEEMPEDTYRRHLENVKASFEKRETERKRIEQDRIEREERERKEQERIKAENEKLKQAAEAREKADKIGQGRMALLFDIDVKEDFETVKAMSEAEWKKFFTQKKKEYDAEQKRLDEIEKQECERREKERNERMKLEAELKAKQEKERLEAEQLEKAKAEKEATEKAKRLAPDKDKLLELAKAINNIEMPVLSNPEAQGILDNTRALLGKTVAYLTEKANQM